MKIAAVVVTHNRKKLLKECLQALLVQTHPLDEIIVIDGASSDGTDKMIKNEFPQVSYIHLERDEGASACFHEGMKNAYVKGYEWIWIMDDDAEPRKNTLEELVKNTNLENAVVLTPVVVDESNEIQEYHRGYLSFGNPFPLFQKPLPKEKYFSKFPVEIHFTSFVGPLINRKAINDVGFPRKDFYIHHDDVEYCIRLAKIGKIYLIPQAVMIHKQKRSRNLEKRFLSRKIHVVPYKDLWKYYYGIRNIIYLRRKYCTNKLTLYPKELFLLFCRIIAIVLFEDHKIKRLRFYISALTDGLRGTFDNEKPKKILYE
jgi:GT2 family glycosyltransferase